MEARTLWMLRAALWLAAAMGASESLTAKEPDTLYWRKTTFALSFNQPRPGRDLPKEVHLHVSSDLGQTWAPHAQSPPDETRFVFKAPQDGEYWFMLRTKFASGQYLPTGRPAPEIKVVVDTAPPTLTLEAREGDGGEVHLRWTASDPNLAAETLHIEYKTTELASNWQRVAIERPALKPGQTEYVGETTIVPLMQGGEPSLIIRADVADKAQNHTAREQPLRLARGRGAGAGAAQTAAADESSDESPPQMQAAFPQAASTATAPNEDRSFPALDASGDPFYRPSRGQAFSDHAIDGARSPERQPSPATGGAKKRDSGPEIAPSGQQPLIPELVHPPVRRRHDQAPTPEETAPPAADVQPHLINKQRFELVYEIDSLGSAGIAGVELWCTRDGGSTWNFFGADDDCRSPMLVNADGEGLYGFRVVAATTSGLRSHEPAPGEPPDVWVEVDLTPPEVRLVSAEQGTGEDADQLVIAWEANDERLAKRPVSLRFREQPDAPWTTIASGLPNSGRYAWRLDHRLPEQVCLQLEVRDEAGNVAADELPEAVSLRQVRPQSHIREVHPVGVLPPGGRRRLPR